MSAARTAVVLLAAAVTLPQAATGQDVIVRNMAQLWDTAAVARVFRDVRGLPPGPQRVRLSFDAEGRLNGLTTTDTVPAPIRQLLRDSLPTLLRGGPHVAGRAFDLYLVPAGGGALLPSCSLISAGPHPANAEQVEGQLNRELADQRSRSTGGASRTGVTEVPGMARRRLRLALVTDGRGHVARSILLAGDATPMEAAAADRALRRLSLVDLAGRPWRERCLVEQVVSIWR